jgi:transposase
MRTAPGMGPVLSCFGLTLFGGQEKLDPRQIASRFGFAPHCYQSGSSVSKPTRSSGYGNGDLRRVFHQAARSIATHKQHYRDYYERKIAEGKHELVVINNIINKLIDLYCTMWNNRADYDPNYIQKMNKQWKKSA